MKSIYIPPLSNWNMYAGGTGSAPDKRSYDIRTGDIQWSIQPASTRHGRHAGYTLWAFGLPGYSGYVFIEPDGTLNPGYWKRLHSRPQSAAVVARRIAKNLKQGNAIMNPPGEVFHAVSRYDRTKHPEKKPYRLMTVEEAKQLRSGSTVLAQGNDGRIANVKVNGKPKTWKTRPGDVDIPWKFGMYEYGTARFRNGTSDGFLVVEVEDFRRTASGQIDPDTEAAEIRRMAEDTRVVRGNPPEELTTREKILLSAFQAHDTLFMHDIPGHFSLVVADLMGKGMVEAHPVHKAAWRLTKKGRLFRANPEVDESGQSGGVHIDVYQKNPSEFSPHAPIRSGFMNELNQEKIVAARETLLGFITIRHGGKQFKVLIDVRKYPDGNLHISTRYHRPAYADAVGPVLSQMDAMIDSSGKVHGRMDSKSGKKKYQANPPATEIYRDIIEIRARKSDGRLYKHPFGKGAAIYGLSDGSLLVKSRKGKRLWKNFPKGSK